ncbi:MAG: type II toxin-antitoxin system RelE/ParE family toxin [Xanthomonadales bacterium]|jgi:toxin ParE1/3/4|nr:type II toxin-antitoxin system RelE/ParE family toxin [Xanthomonadales bacterium]
MNAWRLRALALKDLESIRDFTLERWGVSQAERYLGELFACFDELAANPMLGRLRKELGPGCRSFPQGRHVVFYEIDSRGVEIIALVHQSADVGHHVSRGKQQSRT